MMMFSLRRLAPPTMALPLLFGIQLSHAQTASAPAVQLEEIIVTAQKREQAVQDVPMSITAFGEQRLEELNIVNFTDYARATPGLDFQDTGPTGNRGERFIAIRGVYSPLTGEPTVAYYIDDTPVRVLDPAVFDVDHIEVLRGPQGTLYGGNSMGGLIKIVTKKPDTTASGISGSTAFRTGYTDNAGNPNVSGFGSVNVPVVDNKFAVRVSGSVQHYAGYIDNNPYTVPASSPDVDFLDQSNLQRGFNDSTLMDFRIASRWTPFESLSVSPNILYHRGTEGGRGAYEESQGKFFSDYETPTSSNETYTLYSLPFEWQVASWGTLYSSSTYFDYDNTSADDTSAVNRAPGVFGVETPPSSQRNFRDQKVVTQELRLASSGDQALNWLVGGFYQYTRNVRQAIEYTPGFGDVVNAAYELPPGTIPDLIAAIQATEHVHQAAGFVNVSYKITPALTAQGGVRYTRISNDTRTNRGGFFGRRPPHELFVEADANKTTPSASLTYAFTPEKMIYLTASEGFRAGAGNLATNQDICPETPLSYKPDSLWSYELGTKTQWLDRRLTANFDAYRINWKNIQQGVQLAFPCGANYIDNFGKAHTNGAELELAFAPLLGLSLEAAVAYTDAVVDEATESLNVPAGSPVPLVSKWMYSASGSYSFPVGARTGYVRGNFTHRSASTFEFSPTNTFINPDGTPVPIDNTKEAYGVLGLSFGLKTEGWDAKLFVDNATNESPALGIFYALSADTRRVTTLRPRTIGIELSTKF